MKIFEKKYISFILYNYSTKPFPWRSLSKDLKNAVESAMLPFERLNFAQFSYVHKPRRKN